MAAQSAKDALASLKSGKQQKGNKNRKYGRNRKSGQNAAYLAQGRRLKNKVRRVMRTLKSQPENKQARSCLISLGVSETRIDQLWNIPKDSSHSG